MSISVGNCGNLLQGVVMGSTSGRFDVRVGLTGGPSDTGLSQIGLPSLASKAQTLFPIVQT